MRLSDVAVGNSCKIIKVGGGGVLRGRLLDMGLTPRTIVKVHQIAPLGDPMETTLRGYQLTLRIADADLIEVEAIK